jgi:hypothetical protein
MKREKTKCADRFSPDELDELAPAVRLLLSARQAAVASGRDPWQFAVELHFLITPTMAPNHLRRLVAAGLVEHGAERPARNGARLFQRLRNLAIPPQSCFILTDAGMRLAERWLPLPAGDDSTKNHSEVATPVWDVGRRELLWAGRVVKRFRGPAGNQELVLASFQELGWAARIDDPLPPRHGTDRAARLRETVRALNGRQAYPALRFEADGTGRGIIWRLSSTHSIQRNTHFSS